MPLTTLDAMTDTSLDAHTNSITRIVPRLGTAQEIIDLLTHRSA